MTWTSIFEVWSFPSVAFALIAGLALGFYVIGRYTADPAYASGESTPREYGLLVGGLACAVGLIFFGFQVLGTFLDGDPAWTRVVSRCGIWIMYCAAIGAGVWLKLHRHVNGKHAEARSRAEQAIRS